ncbi:helix-turn-helix domain-containing protein [Pseudarthrobacter sp. MEB009]|uniref:helix-turn-helix domain-containing protein n=1 Tax=Pseudarthrobacter sp. MEB009 TaxID=3040326 RepID=UPI0025521D5D|nr:helix-turn-helix domain-containing protein [Pseudarthrobacter sp. MEB009]
MPATSPTLPRLAYTVPEVAAMLAEPQGSIKKHCQTQALRGAYKTGGKTSPWRIPRNAIDYYQKTRSNQ